MTEKNITPAMPYILLAPGYKESSLGIQVVHRLCHLLNEAGYDARLIECDVNPDWNTPVISFEDYLDYSEGGEPCIAIYPEVVEGNPLNAPIVVRYMLNREGVIEQNKMNAAAEDLYFWYRSEFAAKAFDPQMLSLEAYDASLFCDDKTVKDLDLLYLNRVPRSKVDFSTLPADVRILSMENPLSLTELAAVLKRGRVLYTYESSGTCFLANLCGCPVVARTLRGYETLAMTEDTVKDNAGGIAWNDTPEEIVRTRQTLPSVRQWLFSKREKLDRQMQVFIAQTQQRAADIRERLPQYTLPHWLAQREITPSQRHQVAARMTALPSPASLLIVVRNESQDSTSLEATLTSLAACRAGYPHFRVVLTSLADSAVGLPWVSIATDDRVLQRAKEQWVQVVDAGVRFLADGFCTLGLSLSSAPECFAVFADELVEEGQGEVTTALRPDFNLDLVLSTPWRYARRWLFRLDAVNSMTMELSLNLIAWELEAITRLIELNDIAGIGHISEPLLVVPHILLQPDEIDIAVIQRHLEQRGYADGQVQVNGDKPWRLCYGETQSLMVSVIIPASNSLNDMQTVVDQMLINTSHELYEIIIVRDATTSAAVNAWLDSIVHSQTQKIPVVTLAGIGNDAAKYNAGAAAARGDFILLVNPYVIVIEKDWLTHLLNHAQRPEVGSVGGKIISLNRHLVLSAGEILVGEELCAAVGYGAAVDEPGYMQRLQSDQNYTVLNYSCLMIKKEAWNNVAGMDDSLATLKQQNIDLCLKLRQAGYMSVWTPHSIIACDAYFLYPKSKQVTKEELQGNATLRANWLPHLLRDPAYNDHFSTLRKLFKPECRPALISHPFADRPLPVVLGITLPAAAHAPESFPAVIDSLSRKKIINGLVTENALDYGLIHRADADAMVISGELSDEARALIIALKKRQSSIIAQVISPAWIIAQGRNVPDLTGIDRLIVHNAAQAEAVRQYDRPVVILPRSLASFTPRQKGGRRAGDKLRVLCNTCELSDADIELVHNLVRELAAEVSWQVLGPLPAGWEPWIEEHYRYPGDEYYLPQLAQMDTDLAMIPRADNKLNRLKDDFSLKAFAACAIPALVSDVGSLQGHIPALRVRNRKADWLAAIRTAASERNVLADLAHSAQQALRDTDWLSGETINQHLRAWLP
ncbi:glycosyltransferase [Pantoea agglomerans]|uniref:Glycosyltransferase n=1 Tax=Enterobacter agglomerans TaxID=549 RepID=A0ACC5RQY1_ENTAG|nr:glycosyltransferase [Pantoea agglomerans]MBK4726998.1 glycosyltransferase [Pantoea agglomerans]